jgi:predicted glycosyltransferase
VIKKPRILLYSHDTYGLGHLRRSLTIAWQLAMDVRKAHQLLVTGSMVAGAFELPPRLDVVKLPALSKRSNGKYKARALPLSLRQTLEWREQMLLQTTINFRPHLILVDKVAGGVMGELLPTLRYLKAWSPDTRIVLGMRDIEDSPEVTRKDWVAEGVIPLLEDVYDRILLYGQRSLFDPLTAYGITSAAAEKVTECGYLRRDCSTVRQPSDVRRELDVGERPLVLVTVGGGGDGYAILETYLRMLSSRSQPPAFHGVLITGPLMPQAKRNALQRLAKGCPVTLLTFTTDLLSYMNAADLVVSMAGYNTVCELLSLRKRALLIPRDKVRTEQRIRAICLAERGLAHLLLPDDLTPARLYEAIHEALASPPPTASLELDGLQHASQAIIRLLEDPSNLRPSSRSTRHSKR